MKKSKITFGICLTMLLLTLKCEGIKSSDKFVKQVVKQLENSHAHDPDFKSELTRSNKYRKNFGPSLDSLRQQLDQGLDPNSCFDGTYLLTQAIKDGNIDDVKLLLEYGASITPPISTDYKSFEHGGIPINAAALEGNSEIFKLLLDHGGDLSGSFTHPLLYFAAYGGSVEILQMLVDKVGGLEEARKLWPSGPEYSACSAGHIEVLDWLIKNGAKLDPELLVTAAHNGQSEIMDYLITKGVYPSKELLESPYFANNMIYSANPKIFQQYLQWGGTIPDLAPMGFFMFNENKPSVALLEYLAQEPYGDKLLQDKNFAQAVLSNVSDIKTLKMIFDKGKLDFNQFYLNRESSYEMLEFALEKGMNPNVHPHLLEQNVEQGELSAVRLLISKGANVNHESDGYTPLMLAVVNDQYDVMIALIEGGANLMRLNVDGRSALDEAIFNESSPSIINKLRELGVPERPETIDATR